MNLDYFKTHKAYIELTNPIHGGEGWDFGEVLWSPAKDLSGKDVWKILKQMQPGDVIFHSVKYPSKTHELTGVSIVKSSFVEVETAPPIPGRWGGYKSYLRVPLQSYSFFENPMKLKDFLIENSNELIRLEIRNSFYTRNADQIAQKYAAEIPMDVLKLLLNYILQRENHLFENIEAVDSTDSTFHEGFPARVKTTTTRIIRDTKIIKELKEKYHHTCQICGMKIQMPNQKGYSEGHHLQKLGGLHRGPDINENVIILCPNHHTEFDYGIIAINNGIIQHIDPQNPFHGKPVAYTRSDLSEKYLKYHLKHIFNKNF